ncbi:hypothetical protein CC1G_15560 [Coprinopsis cinerea okayama7|uniref:Uncharacterized protein n=1 Tax=Coprinopsis cinerea (strain Okayama-7 / 130 / ATCC MYA-4618 / FGSC 9003) TaxID=240176 RepID=D6RN63_COPC7|nr:hypothetical protein CC1G_15560 [Coprinopsis cinerea okayama7\|eukprot:XP_002911018.1 hypothetical protein CC1G_15560 [Coprinopsis cinerea okayama7\
MTTSPHVGVPQTSAQPARDSPDSISQDNLSVNNLKNLLDVTKESEPEESQANEQRQRAH